MQWFIGINEGCPAFKQYAEMAKVALHTASRVTSLRPHVLYDGEDNGFTRWLRDRKVPVIRRRTFLLDELEQLALRENDPAIASVARGVFLRAELPALYSELRLDDRVLYTDCDVIFRSDVVADLEDVACSYFNVAAEFSPSDYENMNSGVMLMNLRQLSLRDREFREFIKANLAAFRTLAWDQGAYRAFFRAPAGTRLWGELPPDLNWKPYWGDYSTARVIHFHGPKPFQRSYIDSHYPELKHLTGGSYQELCDLWSELLREAN